MCFALIETTKTQGYWKGMALLGCSIPLKLFNVQPIHTHTLGGRLQNILSLAETMGIN